LAAEETTGGPKAADADRGAPIPLRESYETLRRGVLSGEPGSWRLGHGVLVVRGMAAWMAAWAAGSAAPVPETTASLLSTFETLPIHPPPRAPSSRPGAAAIVTALTQMILARA
jgi:hypothetical protein